MTIKEKYEKYTLGNFGKRDFVISRASGCHVFDENGRKYLDFGGGIAVMSLGHSNKNWIKTVKSQLDELVHCSNLYLTKPHADLAEALVGLIGKGRIFLCNSGTEANEALIKLALLHGAKVSGLEGKKCKILTAKNGFHGRTLGSLAATAQEKIQKGFSPILPNFEYGDFNDADSFRKLAGEDLAAILVEPVQGESGVTPATKEFLSELRKICDEKNALLLFDEVQCGCGRSGKFLACQKYGVKPDALSMAKGIGGGFPIGAIWVSEKHSELFTPGSHGTTFGGNPLACAASLAVLKEMSKRNLAKNAEKEGRRLAKGLEKIARKYPDKIKLTRGLGLMRSVLFNASVKNSDACSALRKNGLILIPAGANSLRFLPPLNVSDSQVDSALKIFDKTIGEL